MTFSLVGTQWVEDPYVAAARVLRALPASATLVASSFPGGVGELARGIRGVSDAGLPSSARRARRRTRVALALNDAVGARKAWDAFSPRDRLTEARLLAAEGSLSRAIELLTLQRGHRSVRVRELLAGERSVLAPAEGSLYSRPAGGSRCSGQAVIHVVTNALPEVQAGYTVRTQGIAKAQVQAGADVVVRPRRGFPVTIGALGSGDTVVVDGVRSVRDIPWRMAPRADVRLEEDVASLVGLVERERPRVLHAHSNYVNARVALRARAVTGVPVVYEVRGFLEETWRSRGGAASAERFALARASETQAMLAADHVVTISEGMAADIRARGVERVTVIPNSVDDSFLGPVPDASAIRSRLGIRPGEVVVGIVTTLNAYEGVDVLVDAVERIEAPVPVHLLVVGDGPERAALTDRAATLLGERGHVVGQVPYSDIRTWFAAIDVFAVPRLDLPVTTRVTPIKPLEAMATGRPVVASDLQPLREIVQEGATGWFADPGDPVRLAEVLGHVVRDRGMRDAAGARARRWVTEERTWARAAAAYEAIYEEVSDETRHRRSGS